MAAALLALVPAQAEPAPPGAAACTGCHAPARAGSRLASIAGRSATDLETAMQDFRSGRRPATVMDRIAKGFSDEEIRAIAGWFAAQQDIGR